MKSTMVILLALLCLSPSARAEEPMGREIVRKLLDATSAEERGALIQTLLALKPDPERIAEWFAAGRSYGKDVETGWLEKEVKGSDGVIRPYLLFVPEDYDPAKKYRFLIDMHGGVSRPDCLTHEQLGQMKFFWGSHAEEHGYFLALPAGQKGAEWWSAVGTGNVLSILAGTKREYNIDDDRVVATGFSDGGSGSFYLGLAHPTPFAAFLPLNGHVGVAGVGGFQVHLRNLVGKPLYIANTENDSLYPSAGVKPFIDALKNLGASVVWRDIPKYRHEPTYLDDERPAIWEWLSKQKRVAEPKRILWEGTAKAPSRVHWLEVTGVKETGNDIDFPDVNPMLTSNRVLLGITIDQAFEGPGVKVDTVNEGSPAAGAGMKVGDVILALDETEIGAFTDLRAALRAKKRGQRFAIVVRRGEESLDLEGRFPEATSRPAFPRGEAYGSIEIAATGNSFAAWVRHISSFDIYLSSRLVDLSKPITVTVNGMTLHRAVVKPDPRWLVDRALADRDRSLVYTAKLTIEVPRAK
jgi:hypothetical protein